MSDPVRTCRSCGCTDHHACVDPVDGPCWWVAPDQCSHCAGAMAVLAKKLVVAQDLGSALVSIEARHALQLQKMTTWLDTLPTVAAVAQVKAGVEALAERVGG